MAQTGYTPISLYYTTTAAGVPLAANLVSGELAINITDGKLFYKDNSGTVQVLATKGAGTIGGSNTQVQYNNSGALAGSANLTFNGTTLTANTLNLTNALGTTYGGTGLTSFTSGGVVYASSSSALATGSALTFDGTSLGLGAAIPIAVGGYSVIRINGSTGGILELTSGNTRVLQIQSDGASAGAQITTVNNGSNPPLIFGVNSSEQMRLTSTGLGIGTSSPSAKLDVNSSAAAVMRLTRNGGTAANTALQYFNGTVSWYAGMSASGLYSIGYNDAALDSGAFRLDSSGNLGLGITPSAWASDWKTTQIGARGVLAYYATTPSTFLGLNFYYAGSSGANPTYINTGAASFYQQVNGQHLWFNAPSGTAGNAITFTQAMTLDASGRLLVGLTSALANGKLQVAGSIGLSGNTEIRQATASDGNTLRLLATQVVVGTSNSQSYDYTGGGLLASVSTSASAITLDTGGATAGHRLRVQNDGTGSSGVLNYSEAGTSRFYVNSSTGNVGIGTSSPNASSILDVQSTTKGVRMPNMTTTQKNAIASPAAGLMVFDTTLSKLCVYTGAAWQTITSV